MHNGTQISSKRNRRNVIVKTDSKGRTVYICKICGIRKYKVESIKNHIKNCKLFGQNGIDFVICKICNWHAKCITAHIKREHKIKAEEYECKYGSVICSKATERYSDVNVENGNWIKRATDNGIDLSEYWQKVGSGVRKAILSNPEEIKRRSKLRGETNRTPHMRKIVSNTAKKTSSRKDIQLQRAKILKQWQDDHADEFYEKCTFKMLNTWQSKPETDLGVILAKFKKYLFKRNQVIKSELFITKSKRKQVDYCDKKRRIYIEYDGPLHFKQTALLQLDSVRLKDKLLDEHIIKHKWMLIRISFDQYTYKNGFSPESVAKLTMLLSKPISGIYKIGEAYDKY